VNYKGETMFKKFFIALFLLFSFSFCLAKPVEYCEEIRDFQKYPGGANQALKELIIKTEKKAIRELFAVEFDNFVSTLNELDIVDSLRNLLQHDEPKVKNGGLFTPCIVLKNPLIKKKDIFEPIVIGKVCHFNSNLLEKHVNQLQQAFILTLKGQYKGKENINSIMSMLYDPKNVKNRSNKRLSQYVHQEKLKSNSAAIEGIQCIALFVYPVELYTESTH